MQDSTLLPFKDINVIILHNAIQNHSFNFFYSYEYCREIKFCIKRNLLFRTQSDF